jgi:hypothetical protein
MATVIGVRDIIYVAKMFAQNAWGKLECIYRLEERICSLLTVSH